MFLENPKEAVMVGEEQPGRRDERGRAPAGTDHRREQSLAAGGIPEAVRGEFQALPLKPGAIEFQDLGGGPFSFGCVQTGGEQEGGGGDVILGAFKFRIQLSGTTAANLPDNVDMVKVLVADDHTIIRSGLRHLLEREPDFQVIGEAADGREALDLALKMRPDVVLLDIAMPKLNGIDAGREIAAHLPKASVIILSMHSDEGYVLKALKAGARGYLLKDSAESDIINAVRAVGSGKAYFSPEISRMMVDDYVRGLQQRGVEDSYELLSLREREVMQLLAEGKSNKEIAGLLGVSLHTIETHRSNIFEKLNLHSLPELILYAVRKGVIS